VPDLNLRVRINCIQARSVGRKSGAARNPGRVARAERGHLRIWRKETARRLASCAHGRGISLRRQAQDRVQASRDRAASTSEGGRRGNVPAGQTTQIRSKWLERDGDRDGLRQPRAGKSVSEGSRSFWRFLTTRWRYGHELAVRAVIDAGSFDRLAGSML